MLLVQTRSSLGAADITLSRDSAPMVRGLTTYTGRDRMGRPSASAMSMM
jgi:hypothetical protein